MDENKVIRPMDFVRLTNIDELNVIKDTKNHIGLVLEDSYFLINDRNVFSLCLAECSDYDLYELVHNIDTDSDQGK